MLCVARQDIDCYSQSNRIKISQHSISFYFSRGSWGIKFSSQVVTQFSININSPSHTVITLPPLLSGVAKEVLRKIIDHWSLTSHGASSAISQHNGLLVLSLPGYCRLGVTSDNISIRISQGGNTLPRFTFQADRGPLHGDGVIGGLIIENIWSLHNLQHANLTDHRLGVNLTHVVARVVPLNLPDVKFPSVVTVVTHLMLFFFVIVYHGGLQKPVMAHECNIVTHGPWIVVLKKLVLWNLSSPPVHCSGNYTNAVVIHSYSG